MGDQSKVLDNKIAWAKLDMNIPIGLAMKIEYTEKEPCIMLVFNRYKLEKQFRAKIKYIDNDIAPQE